jgi:hypothetical protein
MKKTLLVLAAAAMIVLGFTSCGGEKTYTELLTGQTKGWVLSAATSEPGYLLNSGRTTADLMDGYLYEEEMDDIITFQENGIMTIDPGTKTTPDYGYQTTVIANWNLSADNSTLNMQIPFFYDETNMMYDQEAESCKIVSLTSKELVVAYTFNDDEAPAKGTYTFTLTYVPAK